MKIDFREFLSINFKWLVFLGGVIFGLLLSMFLMIPNRVFKVVELDLNKIINTYSVAAAKSGQAMNTINKDFKEQFNRTMAQMPPKTIVINKGQLLSRHETIDYTKNFIESMAVNRTRDHSAK